ncbi:hypothetical protein ACPCSG_26925, partial [Streptomyces cellulosae]
RSPTDIAHVPSISSTSRAAATRQPSWQTADNFREGIPGEPLPELPDEAGPPDAVPLPAPDYAPLEDAPADHRKDSLACDVCDRPFKSERGRDTHRRQAHPEA